MIKILPWTTKEPLSMIGYCAGYCWGSPLDDNEKNIKRAKNCISSGHGRTEEYPDIYCTIDGYSARCIRELARHCIGTTFLQESTRYVDAKNMDIENDFFYPTKFNETQKEIIKHGFENIMDTYKKLEEIGVNKEDAANVLPLGMNTKIVYKLNLRALEHFFHKRACSRAYHEIRDLCKELKSELYKLSDEWKWICDNMLVPECEHLGYCPESKGCGRKISKKEMLKAVDFWNENKNHLFDDGR